MVTSRGDREGPAAAAARPAGRRLLDEVLSRRLADVPIEDVPRAVHAEVQRLQELRRPTPSQEDHDPADEGGGEAPPSS